ncbi:MAG: HEAT repeat domain-containing protein [Planctomycetaceae bacterium]
MRRVTIPGAGEEAHGVKRAAIICGCWLGLALAASGCADREPPFDVQTQIRLLEGADEEGRWAALTTLRDAGAAGGPAVDVLRTMLRGTRDEVLQSEIARAVAGIGGAAAPAVPDLIPLLASSDAWVRTTAAQALGSIGVAAVPALPKLAPLAKDPDPDAAEAAREAVRRIRRAQKR